jgi:predicted permease
MTVLQLSLKLMIYIAVGYAARRLKVMQDGFDKALTRFVMAIPLPCMVINSFRIEYSADKLLDTPLLIGLSVGGMVFLFFVTTLLTGGAKTKMGKTCRFALLFTNFTFIGLPVVSELYGPEGTFNYVVFTLPVRVMFYGGAAVMLGKGGERMNWRETLKKFLCEPVIAVFIGFFLYVTRIDLPAVITSTISSLGAMASPLGLILCGTILADAKWSDVFRHPVVFAVAAARLLLIPALMVGVGWLIGVKHEIIRTTMFYYAMPVASLLPTFLLRYDPEAEEARLAGGCMVVVSTLLCIVTIPLWAALMDRFLQ